MAPHIVSWGINALPTSPAPSSSASVVSFESMTSDIHTPKAPEDATDPETGTNAANSSTSEPSTYPGIDDSFPRHDTYFFKDGNITFLVDGTLYCVHRFFFSRDSVYFSTRLAQLSTRDHEALTTVVSLGDVEREDFEALLSVIYPKDFEEHNLSYQQWKSVLHLSTRWGFASIRRLAVKSIEPPTPHDRLVLARTHAVDQWVLPALTALCERPESLTLTEARQMRIEDVVLVAAVREEVRNRAFTTVDTAKVSRSVQAALAGKSSRNGGNSASEGGAAKQGTSTTPGLYFAPAGANIIPSFFTQWEGRGVAKSSEENTVQGAGKATAPTQAAQKPEGERDPGPSSVFVAFPAPSPFTFASTAKTQKPSTGKQEATKAQSFFGSAEKPSPSSKEIPLQAKHGFNFGQSSAAAASPSSSTPLRSVETSSPSPEPIAPTAKKAKTPKGNPTDLKMPLK